MTKQDIIAELSNRTGVEKSVTKVMVDETISIISENLCKGEQISLRGLFTLERVKRAQKTGRDITRHKNVVIPAHYAPHATFSREIISKMKETPIEK